MSSERHHIIRDTLHGALSGAGLIGTIAVIQALRAGVVLGQVVQPILVFVLIGLTVGGLTGPLVGRAIRRHRTR
jgi:hypothetical protein